VELLRRRLRVAAIGKRLRQHLSGLEDRSQGVVMRPPERALLHAPRADLDLEPLELSSGRLGSVLHGASVSSGEPH